MPAALPKNVESQYPLPNMLINIKMIIIVSNVLIAPTIKNLTNGLICFWNFPLFHEHCFMLFFPELFQRQRHIKGINVNGVSRPSFHLAVNFSDIFTDDSDANELQAPNQPDRGNQRRPARFCRPEKLEKQEIAGKKQTDEKSRTTHEKNEADRHDRKGCHSV